jgi:hypothetical protein
MTKAEITKAMRDQDHDAIDALGQEFTAAAGNVDRMISLLERIQKAIRADTVNDVIIDLKFSGETGAAEIIKANYLS